MIQSYTDLILFVESDCKSKGVTKKAKSFLLDPVTRFTILLRWCEYLHNTKKPLFIRGLFKFYFRRLSIRLGFSIPLNVFEKGLAIVHYGLIVINPAAKIGQNCRIHVGVNIGGSAGLTTEEQAKKLAPVIGDNCYIGPGAKIFGPVSIGRNVVIGANAVVNKSFPDNVTLAGVPAKIISQKNSEGMLIYGCQENNEKPLSGLSIK